MDSSVSETPTADNGNWSACVTTRCPSSIDLANVMTTMSRHQSSFHILAAVSVAGEQMLSPLEDSPVLWGRRGVCRLRVARLLGRGDVFVRVPAAIPHRVGAEPNSPAQASGQTNFSPPSIILSPRLHYQSGSWDQLHRMVARSRVSRGRVVPARETPLHQVSPSDPRRWSRSTTVVGLPVRGSKPAATR